MTRYYNRILRCGCMVSDDCLGIIPCYAEWGTDRKAIALHEQCMREEFGKKKKARQLNNLWRDEMIFKDVTVSINNKVIGEAKEANITTNNESDLKDITPQKTFSGTMTTTKHQVNKLNKAMGLNYKYNRRMRKWNYLVID